MTCQVHDFSSTSRKSSFWQPRHTTTKLMITIFSLLPFWSICVAAFAHEVLKNANDAQQESIGMCQIGCVNVPKWSDVSEHVVTNFKELRLMNMTIVIEQMCNHTFSSSQKGDPSVGRQILDLPDHQVRHLQCCWHSCVNVSHQKLRVAWSLLPLSTTSLSTRLTSALRQQEGKPTPFKV